MVKKCQHNPKKIKQNPILNGSPGYDAHWAGTRQKVDGESWYVGQGPVNLYYVDSYTLESLFELDKTDKDKLSFVDTIKVEPVAINNEETHTSDFGFSIGEAIGTKGGKDGAKGTVSLNWGLSFNESISVNR